MKSITVNIHNTDEIKWSIKYFNRTAFSMFYFDAEYDILYENLNSGQKISSGLLPYCNYMITFSEVEEYKLIKPKLVIFQHNLVEDEPDEDIVIDVNAEEVNVVIEDKYKYKSVLIARNKEKPVIKLNEVNLDLTVKTREFYEKLKLSAFTSKHHFESNSHLYNLKSSGKIHLFLKNFVTYKDAINGLDNVVYYKISENEVNRLDLVSWHYYRNPELIWVIMAVNNIQDPFNVPEGTVLKIIPKDFIELVLLRKEEVI